jgi:hypothetical protein
LASTLAGVEVGELSDNAIPRIVYMEQICKQRHQMVFGIEYRQAIISLPDPRLLRFLYGSSGKKIYCKQAKSSYIDHSIFNTKSREIPVIHKVVERFTVPKHNRRDDDS